MLVVGTSSVLMTSYLIFSLVFVRVLLQTYFRLRQYPEQCCQPVL